jgi:hypothetical protein
MTDNENTPTPDEHDAPSAANDSEGTTKPDGLGEDGTIPNEPDGIAVGHQGDDSHFNPEEDDGRA